MPRGWVTLCPPPGGGMPWKECHVMDERLRFVARLLEGERATPFDFICPSRNVAWRKLDPNPISDTFRNVPLRSRLGIRARPPATMADLAAYDRSARCCATRCGRPDRW